MTLLGLGPVFQAAQQMTPQAPDAELAQLLAALHQATVGAQGEQATAATNYNTEAAAPSGQLNPADVFLPHLLSNLASVIGKTPDYRHARNEDIAQQRRDLMAARVQNLASLKDLYDKKAQAAQQAQDHETEQTFRVKHDQVAKAQAELLEKMHQQGAIDLANHKAGIDAEGDARNHGFRMDEIAASGNQARQTKGTAGAADAGLAGPDSYFSDAVVQTRDGVKFFDMTDIPVKDRRVALQYAHDNKLVAADKDTAGRLRQVEEVKTGLDQIEALVKKNLTASTNPLQIAGAGAKNTMGAFLQSGGSGGDLAAWNNTRLLAIRNIQALAGGMGSGFRLNQAEIKTIVENFPKLTDNVETANRKITFEREYLANKERTYLSRDWRQAPGSSPETQATPKASATVRLVNPKGRVFEVDSTDVRDAIAHGWKRASR